MMINTIWGAYRVNLSEKEKVNSFSLFDNNSIKKKRYIHICQCRIGDIIADDIYDNHGFLIMPKYAIIDKHAIKRLKTFRIRQLSIYDSQDG